jgi:hypothetical protein
MSTDSSMHVVPGLGGWVYVHVPGFAGRLYVRASLTQSPPVELDFDGRAPRAALKVVDLVLDGEGQPIGAPFLRDLSLSAVETLLNEPSVYRQICERLSDVPPHLDVTTTMSHFQDASYLLTTEKQPRPAFAAMGRKPRPSLQRPATRQLPDEFFRELADFYVYAVAHGERPLVAIEREASVPRNTAARWVATARRKGFLATDPSVKSSRKESDGQQARTRSQGTGR